MDVVPLSTPDGVVVTYMCGKCWRTAYTESLMNDHGQRVDEHKLTLRQKYAQECCTCRECGGYVNGPYQYPFICPTCRPAYDERQAAALAKYRAEADERALLTARSLDKSPNPTSARTLESLMSEISEARWCAGWLTDLEYYLWRDAHADVNSTMYNYAGLLQLAKECDGWWEYERFIPMNEWLEKYATWEKTHGEAAKA